MESGIIANSKDVYELCERFSSQSSYKFCPELDWDLYEQKYFKVICYHLKSVRYSTKPFQRVGCPVWFEQPKKVRALEKYSNVAMCSACKRLINDLD